MAPRSSLPTSSKKRKHASDEKAVPDVVSSIKSLEDRLIAAVSSKSSLNPLADLLDIARNASNPETLSKTMYALYRIFVVIITNGLLLNIAGNDETKAVRAWLQEKLHSYVKLLVGLLRDEESILKVRHPSIYIASYVLIKSFTADVLTQHSILAAEAPLDDGQQGSWV